jgi:class 3 adenylate cyclase
MNDLNRRNPAEEARNVLSVAFKMLKIIQIVREQVGFDGLHMRIGIHTVTFM